MNRASGKRWLSLLVAALLGGATLSTANAAATAAADKIYVNARVWTGRTDAPYAQAIAVAGERILAAGSTKEVAALRAQQTEVIDLKGAFVVPGFIDNHVHFINGGLSLAQVDLRDAKTPQEFSRRIAAAAKARPGKWITDGNWDHELWGTLPTRDWIDAATASTPVLVYRLDGHMALANSLALKLAGITDATPDPEGGTIVRDKNGRATGVLKDTAFNLVTRVIPPASDQQIDEALERATEYALSRGVTQVHDMGMEDWRSLEAYERALAGDRLRLRVYAFVPLADWERLAIRVKQKGRGSDRLRWGGVKGFVDGSLGSTTVIASMQPYHAIDDGRWAEKRIGARRLQGTYAFRSLLDAGAHLTFGSDWPVAPIDPLIGIYAAATRRTIDNAHPDGWQPEQKISVEQALRAYTSENAYAGFQQASLGTITPGYLADFVVLSRNLLQTDPAQIPAIEVLRTVIGGRDELVRAR